MSLRLVIPGTSQLNEVWPGEAPNPDLSASVNYNSSPATMIPIVSTFGNTQPITLNSAYWGLLPEFAPDKRFGKYTATADIETVLTRRSFREPIRAHRVLVPVLGFYLWGHCEDGRQRAFYVSRSSQELMTIAGVANPWVLPAHKHTASFQRGSGLLTASIITQPSPDLLKTAQSRAPAVVAQDFWDHWLNSSSQDVPALVEQLEQQTGVVSRDFQYWPVGDGVFNIRQQGEHLIEPVLGPMSGS